MTTTKILARRLLLAADDTMRDGGIDPNLCCLAVLAAWERAKPEHFARLALIAGMQPPKLPVIARFFDLLKERVERRFPGYLAQYKAVGA